MSENIPESRSQKTLTCQPVGTSQLSRGWRQVVGTDACISVIR